MNKKQTSSINMRLLILTYLILFLILFSVSYFFSGRGLTNSLLLSLFIMTLSFVMIFTGDKLIKK